MAVFPGKSDGALEASFEILNQLQELNRNRGGDDSVLAGIGLHTGSVMLGTIGNEARMEGTVISDVVNVASRIESLTRFYDSTLLVSKPTINGATKTLNNRYLGKVQVKGKTNKVEIFEILGNSITDRAKLDSKQSFEEGLNLFFDQKFAEASVHFSRVAEDNSTDRAARIYLERSADYMVNGVPSDWEA